MMETIQITPAGRACLAAYQRHSLRIAELNRENAAWLAMDSRERKQTLHRLASKAANEEIAAAAAWSTAVTCAECLQPITGRVVRSMQGNRCEPCAVKAGMVEARDRGNDTVPGVTPSTTGQRPVPPKG